MEESSDFEPGFKRARPAPIDAPDYRCAANGCPLRATVTDATSGPFRKGRCRYHDQIRSEAWPAITQIFRNNPFRRSIIEPQLAALGVRWREDQELPPPAAKPPGWSSQEWVAHHTSLIRCIKAASDPDRRAWARKLKAREESGEPLHPVQAQAWRQALGVAGMTEAEQEALEERLAIQSEARP